MGDAVPTISLGYVNPAAECSSAYLWPHLRRLIAQRQWTEKRAFDLGCGSGATCGMLAALGFDMTGIDLSESGIAQARLAYPQVKTFVGSVYDDLAARYGCFPLVVSLEVIEHCVYPHAFARTFLGLIAPGGVGFLSTPYHGYLKNIALAVSGKMDWHFGALNVGGHIKFFSIDTLGAALRQAGAKDIEFHRAGRIPAFAKSMIAIVRMPS
jgi:2-polyprenyl-6-hydroxyphenyl methylase/3-demethylubiquinone-9 3-methyltransferase